MLPRIAIPVPHSTDPEYAERAFPQYAQAVEMAGGDPVRIPLDQSPTAVVKLIEGCDAVLLPGSKADIDPAKYTAARDARTAPADPMRDAVDHEAGRDVRIAHTIDVDSGSKAGRIVAPDGKGKQISVAVNSSHHQSAEEIGDGLRIVARCPQDGIIEALEGTSPDHFVLAVQWHPERSVENDEGSRAIFHALVEAARH